MNNTLSKKMASEGFTLVEILIAVFILSLVMSIVYVSYTGTLKNTRQLVEEGTVYQMARISMDRLIHDLSSLQKSAGHFDLQAEKKTLGDREFHSISFWSAAHLALGENESEGCPGEISYFVKEDEDGQSFSLWRLDVAGTKSNETSQAEGGFVICKNIEAFNLIFYDSSGREHDSWNTSSGAGEFQGKVPITVKIELFLVNKNDLKKPYKFMTKVFLPTQ